MNRPSSRRRPSSGANTGLKRRKSNLEGDGFYESTNISDSFPRQKPGIMPQAYSYGTKCGTTTYTAQGLQQSYDNRTGIRNLISETTLDTLRRFRYRSPQTPSGEKLGSEPLDREHGHYSTMWKDSGSKPNYDHNSSLPSAGNSLGNHSLPVSLRNAGGALGPGDIGMAGEADLHHPIHTNSFTSGNPNASSEYRKAVISEQGSPCSDFSYQDELDNLSNVSQVTARQGSDSINSPIIHIQEIEIPEQCPEFYGDELALTDANSRENPSVGIHEAANALGGPSISQEHATPLKFAEQPEDVGPSYGGYAEDPDDEYAMDPEYFSYATEAPIPDEPYSNNDYWNTMPDCEASKNGETSTSEVQDGVRDSAMGQSSPFIPAPATGFTTYTSPPTSSNQAYEEYALTSYFERPRVTYSQCNQGQKTISSGPEAKHRVSQATSGGNQFTSTGHTIGDNSSRSNPSPSSPFLRHPFPSPVRNRSHIQGLSSHTVLRTCFRIGEAFKASSSSLSAAVSRTTVIELYAVLVASYYSGITQYFTFADLFFPTRPPYLTGKWAGGNPNSDILTRRTDRDGKDDMGSICRVIGTISSSGGDHRSPNNIPAQSTKGMTMIVQGIWRADWGDIEYVKGIVEA